MTTLQYLYFDIAIYSILYIYIVMMITLHFEEVGLPQFTFIIMVVRTANKHSLGF